MRGQSPTPEDIDSIALLCATGLSLQEVGKQLGFCANTVRTCLTELQIVPRDVHG